MPGTIKHRFVSTVPDEGVSSEFGPNELNDSLVVTGGADGEVMMRRTSAGDGWDFVKMGAFPSAVNITQAANSGTGETDLHSHTIVASHFNVTNRGIRFVGMGSFAGNTNAKTLKIKFGAAGTVTLNPTTTAPNGVGFAFQFELFRSGANTQRYILRVWIGTGVELISTATFAETEANALALKVTGQGGASSDILLNATYVEYLS